MGGAFIQGTDKELDRLLRKVDEEVKMSEAKYSLHFNALLVEWDREKEEYRFLLRMDK